PVVGINMGQTAEELATRFDIDREAMDRYALRSHRRLAQAMEEGIFEDEIVPLYDREGQVYTADDGVRPDTDMDQLGRLRPVFDRVGGRVTAGNSAQVSDGAAALLLASAEAVERFDLPVLGRIRDVQWAGLSPRYMGLGPVYAMAPLLQRHALSPDDIDNWEINEAFAAQVLACLAAWTDPEFCHDELDSEPLPPIDEERLNIHGGGISLGHPVGASGARITLHCLNNLKRSGGRHGVASLCIGGGQGGALLLEAAP
ncbi:MAG: acetyl-CoA C-acyltransferase, partial [Gammaproteobacteria bacterium]